jgi:hypothetical protein
MVLKTFALLVLLNNTINLSAPDYWWYIKKEKRL